MTSRDATESGTDLRAALVEPDAHPFRWMLDGTPCWCISADEPHDGWVHAPACQTTRRVWLAVALAATTERPAEAPVTDRHPQYHVGHAYTAPPQAEITRKNR